MRVIKAQTAGFCFGVKRAVDQVYELAGKEEGPVYTCGPIIHNEEVVGDLEKKGVKVLHTKEELSALEKEGRVHIIRPSSPIQAAMIERDESNLERIYQTGRADMKKDLEKLIADIDKKMKKAAAELNFELAAELRDKMIELKKQANEL